MKKIYRPGNNIHLISTYFTPKSHKKKPPVLKEAFE